MRAHSKTVGTLFILLGMGALGCEDDARPDVSSGGPDVGGESSGGESSGGANAGGEPGGDAGSGGEGSDVPLEEIGCDVIIIGGGVSGLHTAFRLAPELGDGVCLFEKEAELGGRIKDVPMDDEPNSPRFGVGARRVMPQQQVLLDLAAELGLLPAYPSITPDASGDTETAFYEELLFGDSRALASDYGDFRTFIREALGVEAYQFLRDASRFRADFEAPLDAEGYMDYLTEEWDVYGDASYPVGGMSAFVRGMADAALADDARVFTSEPVLRIERAGAGYEVVTGQHRASAPKVVVAVPPAALKWIEGDVAEDLKAEPELQDILGVKVVTVTQWWPTNWWSQIVDPSDDVPVWRAWTTEHCVNFVEIPLEPYASEQLVTRSVYDDDANCVELWQRLWEQGGEQAVAEEVQRGLEHLFVQNGVTEPADLVIPQPSRTYVQVWPAAWHWLAAGTEFSNTDVYDWAVEPLDGEDVALVGEAYNVNRSGWSDGAYKSSIHLLNTKYGLDLPGL